ncbi:two-component system sensor histidine kinase NtrB [Crenobacter cavernae]|uniref:histidine kinase n=1 Tax=Crenobacter cavernae TaxID=2290923 RepID=A0A345Y4N6_9NEIS|nr:HAMP domain-containing sensor histidine kinase [Crenobacter cavernae]AXK38888.1 sensor histidine kinase [Crenobacter cavernae]
MIRLPLPATLTPERALGFFNAFRAVMLSVIVLVTLTRDYLGQALADGAAFYGWALAYGVLIALWSVLKRAALADIVQLTLGVGADVVMIVLLMRLNGGVGSGYGMLLLPFLAVASLLASGRYALLYALMASVLLVGAELADTARPGAGGVLQTAFLVLACFVTSAVTWRLAGLARRSEQLVRSRTAQLKRLDRFNALALQHLREAVLVVDDTGTVRQFNREARRLFPNVARGKMLIELAPFVARWRERGDAPSAVQATVHGRHLTGRLEPLAQTRSRAMALFLRDSADLADEARREKLAALGRLTANLAHEIRNPLSAISHAADLIAESADNDAQRRLTRIVRDNTRRIDRLVEEVLALNRRDRVRSETLPLSAVLAEFIEQFALSQPDAAGKVLTHFDAAGVAVAFDRGHLQQILWNLAANAWRHGSRTAGSVRIDVGQSAGRVTLTVHDDGAGVPAAIQPHLFEPFHTSESTGTGLGLYIARELAEANGGALDYRPPGGCFRLTCKVAHA